MKFRKKPVVVEAFKLNERGLVEEDWFWDAVSNNIIITHYFGKFHPEPAWCEINTLEGTMIAKGCNDCAFADTEEWEEPCKRCKRNCRDYWRRGKQND